MQDHHATITKYKCPDNPNHVLQSMSLQLQTKSHSPLPALPFPAIPFFQNKQLHPTGMSSSSFKCFGRQYVTPVSSCVMPCGNRQDEPEQALEGKLPCLAYLFISPTSIWLVLLILYLYFIHWERDEGYL